MRFTWIGGPTFLLELGAFRIIADPVFADRFTLPSGQDVSRAAAVPDVEIPAIDLLVLSCARGDHFDPGSIDRIPGIDTVLVPGADESALGTVPARVQRALGPSEEIKLEKGGEVLNVTATPASAGGNGYFFEHVTGDKRFTAYWTADTRWSNDVRDLQRQHGYANLLVQHLGAESDANGSPISPDGKDAMQFVYRMQPNAVVAVHHNTFSHYSETIEPFRDLISRTIYEKRLRVLAEGESFEKA